MTPAQTLKRLTDLNRAMDTEWTTRAADERLAYERYLRAANALAEAQTAYDEAKAMLDLISPPKKLKLPSRRSRATPPSRRWGRW